MKLNQATVVLKVVASGSAERPHLLETGSRGPRDRRLGHRGLRLLRRRPADADLPLPECKPVGHALDDACSSNSTATMRRPQRIPYAPDYGLANDVSWAAQWANTYGVTNYKNFAISGSEPTNWAPGGDHYALTKAVEAEDPDYILMTIGANPILADTLFGLEPMACAIEADIIGEYRECVEEAFEEVHLRARTETPLRRPGGKHDRDDLPDAVPPLGPVLGARLHRRPRSPRRRS